MKTPEVGHLRDPVQLLALGFGSGLSPRAPGTMGTLVAIPIDLLLRFLDMPWRIAIVSLAIVAGVWLCDASARRLGVHDHPAIVWDEIAAFLVIMLFVPLSWVWIAAAFVLFRLFDIWKPWPIRDLDHSIAGGLGIMLDDVIAAIYTVVFLAGLQLIEI
ncbi:MAG: phosphatidylglycerophosphatase A [Gammaproteobacteria bacterium]|nr:phosphatidylglycerophosphatase A [Gammaproteobacteria bacterium]